jgi:uncharacterized membrane protein (UPF0127 family)
VKPPSLERPRSITGLWWGVRLVFVAGLLAWLLRGADTPKDPYVLKPDAGAAVTVPQVVRTLLPGFGETRITVRKADGKLLAWCLLLAETKEQRERGLMQVTDLGGYDGMLFRYDAPVTESYYMRNTPTPLSIAYLDSTGALVSTSEMAPCEDVEGCPTYPPAGPFQTAIEVFQGNLARLGIEAGATVVDDHRGCA